MLALLWLLSAPAWADSRPPGKCKDGFAADTLVRTETRGNRRIGEVVIGDRVWSFNEMVGRAGWSQILQRVDRGAHYLLLSDFREPGSAVATPACWRIRHRA